MEALKTIGNNRRQIEEARTIKHDKNIEGN